MGAFLEAIVKSVFNTVVIFVILIVISTFHRQIGTVSGGNLYLNDTQASVAGFLTLPPAEYLPVVLAILGAFFLGSLLFHHSKD
ncbi:hypothetical protein GOV11_02850 [Candidatus Woesearchaeota archaeon]|nr:hypothetical protein [Candidatus Woesearchaeota archaeon]